jgi:predicted nucleic acid-binding protein
MRPDAKTEVAPRTPVLVYADTSVYGGCFDHEFEGPSLAFFDQVRRGFFQLGVSPLVEREVVLAPPRVLALYRTLEPIAVGLSVLAEALELRRAYAASKVVGPSSLDDALHVALASVHSCRYIVS